MATGPVAAAFVAERWTREGSSLAVVKVLRDPTPAERLFPLRERSGMLGALRHRHIVTVDQVVDIDGHFGLLAPYVDGMDLLDWMGVLREQGTTVPPRVVCEVLRAIAVALDAALSRVPWGEDDALALPHGDLKPGNVMVDRDGELKVLDFGTGASALAMEEVPNVRSARTYMAPERAATGPTQEADVYALGIMGIELLADRWIHGISENVEDHDLQLGQLVKRLDFTMRSEADEQTLRSLLLKMVAHAPSARPRAAVVAQTLRRLADRAPGPSLESFAHEHCLPYLSNVPENPDTGLMVQVTPVWADTRAVTLQEGPEPDDDTNTMGPGDFGRLMEDEVTNPAFLVDSRSWSRASLSLTDQVADETEKAIEAARQARKLDFAVDFDGIPFYDTEDEVPTAGPPRGEQGQPEPEPPAPVEDVEPDLVLEPAIIPQRPLWQRTWVIGLALAMSFGAFIAVSAVLVGLAVGAFLMTL
ncbi:MAG: protein kinase [Alphaproteobacteria bacterium]|nr:protein kinase [Alphaproteobacteria bacterium]